MELREFLNHQLNQFHSNLKLALENHSPDAIHDFRVALKKIFALYNILGQCIIDFNKTDDLSYMQVKAVFKCAGIIRDNQVMMNIAAQWLSPKIVKQIIDKMIEPIHSGFKELEVIYSELSVEGLNNEIRNTFTALEKMEKQTAMDAIQKYITANEINIKHELQLESCNFHKIRKHVKNQYYLLSVLENVYGDNSKSEMKNRKEIAGKKLGEWHDLKVLMKFMTISELQNSIDEVTKIEERAQNLIKEVK